MKRFVLLLSILLIAFSFSACSRQAADSTFSCLVFQKTGNDVSAFSLTVDTKQNALTLAPEAQYRLTPQDNASSSIEPLLQTDTRLVLRTQPAGMPASASVELADPNALYHASDTLLQANGGQTWSLFSKGEQLYGNLSFEWNGKRVMPACFFRDDAGQFNLIGMTEDSLIDTELVTMQYAPQEDGTLTLIKADIYPSIWEDYDISKVECPRYTAADTNVTADATHGLFLYREGSKLLVISPADAAVVWTLSEADVTAAMPDLDTHRDFAAFFTGFSRQGDRYFAIFPAYNDFPGMYAAIFTTNGTYDGALFCSDTGLTLYDRANNAVQTLEQPLMPLIYIGSR